MTCPNPDRAQLMALSQMSAGSAQKQEFTDGQCSASMGGGSATNTSQTRNAGISLTAARDAAYRKAKTGPQKRMHQGIARALTMMALGRYSGDAQ